MKKYPKKYPKTWTVKVKETNRKIWAVVGVFIIICLFLVTDFGASLLSSATGWNKESIKEAARIGAGLGVGWWITGVGLAMIGVMPVIGGFFAVVGVVLVVWSAVNLYNAYLAKPGEKINLSF